MAAACDVAFPERNNWFSEFYEESKSWVPAGFRSWAEYEDRATELVIWSPGIIDGLAQTEGYARALLSIYPGVTDEVVAARLQGRMERQRRLLRDEGPTVGLLVDMAALYRAIGSAEVMAEQCARLAEVARLEAVTLQVVPPVRIPLATVSLILADNAAAYTENAVSGSVYTEEETVRRLRRLIIMMRAEVRPASESLAIGPIASRLKYLDADDDADRAGPGRAGPGSRPSYFQDSWVSKRRPVSGSSRRHRAVRRSSPGPRSQSR